jgi:hypothetical protein
MARQRQVVEKKARSNAPIRRVQNPAQQQPARRVFLPDEVLNIETHRRSIEQREPRLQRKLGTIEQPERGLAPRQLRLDTFGVIPKVAGDGFRQHICGGQLITGGRQRATTGLERHKNYEAGMKGAEALRMDQNRVT